MPRPEDPLRADRLLPDPLPAEPLGTLVAWLDEATRAKVFDNPNAVALATADAKGRPSVRIVLAKGVEPDTGRVVFFTNRRSKKGRDLAENPWASMAFFWDALDLQARVEGPVRPIQDAESDAYFATRWVMSRVGAWASDQSQPIGSREALIEKVEAAARRFGVPPDGRMDGVVPRPPHWGGYALWADRVELWIGQPGRIHDRAEWRRDLTPTGDGFTASAWRSTRLQP